MKCHLLRVFWSDWRPTRRRSFAAPRCRRLAFDAENLEPRLMLSTTGGEAAEFGTAVETLPGGFLDVGLPASHSSVDPQQYDNTSGPSPVSPTPSDSQMPILPPRQPSPSPLPDEGGFVFPGVGEVNRPHKRLADETAQSTDVVVTTPSRPASALQPARAEAYAFQLASALVPEPSGPVLRVDPPLPGFVAQPAKLLERGPLAADDPVPDVAVAIVHELLAENYAAHEEPEQFDEASLPAMNVEEAGDAAEIQPKADDAAVTGSPGEDATPVERPPQGSAPHAKDAAASQQPTEATAASSSAIAGALATRTTESPHSRTAMVVTLAILAWRCIWPYFLPGKRRPGRDASLAVTSARRFRPM